MSEHVRQEVERRDMKQVISPDALGKVCKHLYKLKIRCT